VDKGSAVRRNLTRLTTDRGFRPGTYTCQVNIIDSIAATVAFPRVSFVVMN